MQHDRPHYQAVARIGVVDELIEFLGRARSRKKLSPSKYHNTQSRVSRFYWRRAAPEL